MNIDEIEYNHASLPITCLSQIAPQLRPAQPDDASALAPLFLGIWDDMALNLPWDSQISLRAMAKSIREGKGRFRWQNNIVWEENGNIAGVVCTYKGEDEPAYLDAFLPYLAHEGADISAVSFPIESKPGEYYLDSIFVHETGRGRGVGSALLRSCMIETVFHNRPLVLDVEEENEGARALYERMGFETFEYRMLLGHRYHAMRYLPEQAKEDFAAILSSCS